MKNRKYVALLIILLFFSPFMGLKAQLLPVVYDGVYHSLASYNVMLQSINGETRLMGKESSAALYMRISGNGSIIHSKMFNDFAPISTTLASDGSMLVVGGVDGGTQKARFFKISTDDKVLIDYSHDSNGFFNKILTLRNGGYLLGGVEWAKGGSKKAVAVILSPTGKFISSIAGNSTERCVGLLESSDGSYTVIFTSEAEDGRVVKFAENGRQIFESKIPGVFEVKQIKQTRFGELLLAGTTDAREARLVKIRPEGAIVFDKVLPSANSAYTHMELSEQDEILVAGYIGSEGYLLFLRNDGTELFRQHLVGPASAISFTPRGGIMVSSFDASQRRGMITKISEGGQVLFDRGTVANFDFINIGADGEATLISTNAGRVVKFNEEGTLITDKQIDKSENPGYLCSGIGENGDIVFAGENGRITKLAHGLTINNIRVQEPINGFAFANFTVTLTGFQRQNGVPLPVTVHYKVVEGKAKINEDINVSSGVLSFVPSDFGSGEYMVEQTIEIPILADNLLEGNENFFVEFDEPENSYLVNKRGEATIVDQPAIVKFIGSQPGKEPSTPITYTIGLFKSDGTEVTNVSGSDVIVRGVFGKGTASLSDFIADKAPLFVIAQGKSQATFQVGVVSDDKYEIPETVILSLNQVQSMSDIRVQLEGGTVNCSGLIYDQPAYLALSSLGDRGRLNSNVSGFFRASLVRASDNKPLINCTGSNILITTEVDDRSTAVKGEDFVLVNETELLIPGDCRIGTANIQGVVLANPAHTSNVKVGLSLVDVTAPEGAGELRIHPDNGVANFNILPSFKK